MPADTASCMWWQHIGVYLSPLTMHDAAAGMVEQEICALPVTTCCQEFVYTFTEMLTSKLQDFEMMTCSPDD